MKTFIYKTILLCTLLISYISFPAYCEEEYALSTEWHKYYEPIENPGVMLYVEKCFTEAKRLFGQPTIAVNEIHMRQSVKRKNLQKLSRAEISDWRSLTRTLYFRKEEPAYRYIWERMGIAAQQSVEKFAENKKCEYLDRLRIITAFNHMIEDENFYNKRLFSNIAPEKRGFSLSRLLSSQETRNQRLNRRVISNLFSGNIEDSPKFKRIAEGVELCECTDEYKGIFTIYVPSSPREDEFYLETAHEVAHLLNAKYFDWYVEGLNNVFAEYMADTTRHNWEPWARLFSNGRNSQPYAISYYMMKEVVAAADGHMGDFLKHGVPHGKRGETMRININSWLTALPDNVRFKVIDIISNYGPMIEKHKGNTNAFFMPGR